LIAFGRRVFLLLLKGFEEQTFLLFGQSVESPKRLGSFQGFSGLRHI
jgi:hypothetical protein